jgi:HD-like signal output (HDOD) protein/CheY-like chemotaxis protein
LKRILFVDDESRVLDGLMRLLRANRTRWEMHFALGAEAALRASEAQSFDVIITDMRMPGMDGATLLGHMRDRFPNTARIILSGYSEATAAARSVSVAHRFLAKPCNALELQSAIERVLTLQELVNSPKIREIVGSVGELPSLSTTYASLTQAVMDPDVSIKQVASIIEHDVAMSAKVLQIANSAFFGLSQHVTNLFSAVSYLGMDTIKNLALTCEAFKAFAPDSRIPQSVCDAIQNHAISVAAIAGVLPVDRQIRDATIVASLLHDIGKLFLASAMHGEFCSVIAYANERGCKFFEAEEELLGTSHAEIGAYLLGLWGIPDLAIEAIAHHHHITRIPHSGFDCTIAVYVADLLAHELEAPPDHAIDTEMNEPERACLETLGLLSKLPEFRELALQNHNCQ